MIITLKKTHNGHIMRQETILYFRQIVPPDLRHIIKKTELRYSLRTPYRKIARRKASALSARIWDIFNGLRKGDIRFMKLTSEDINGLIQKWVDKELAVDEVQRVLDIDKYPVPSRKKVPHEYTVEVTKDIANECRESLAYNDYSFIHRQADALLNDNDFTAEKESFEYKLFCREMLKAQLELLKVFDERNNGKYSPTYTSAPEEKPTPKTKTEKTRDKITLSKAFVLYSKEKLDNKKWTLETLEDNKEKVDILVELIGNVTLSEITQDLLREGQRGIINLPANKSKRPQYRGKTIKQLQKMNIPDNDKLSPATVKNYFSQINGFLKWLEVMYELPTWTSMILTVPKEGIMQAVKAKALFSKEDLEQMFSDEWYLGNVTLEGRRKGIDGASFWLPLMALFSGARTEELCQLYVEDFKIIDNTKCYEITTTIENEDGELELVKHVKNNQSIRIVPLHNVLLELGLWEYVQECKARGQTRLFEELEASGVMGKFARTFTKRFINHIRKDLDIKGNKKEGLKVFYSFRGTFISQCINSGIQDKFFERVVGHQVQGNKITYRHYAKMDVAVLKREVMDKIDFGIDFSHLKNHKYARKQVV